MARLTQYVIDLEFDANHGGQSPDQSILGTLDHTDSAGFHAYRTFDGDLRYADPDEVRIVAARPASLIDDGRGYDSPNTNPHPAQSIRVLYYPHFDETIVRVYYRGGSFVLMVCAGTPYGRSDELMFQLGTHLDIEIVGAPAVSEPATGQPASR